MKNMKRSESELLILYKRDLLHVETKFEWWLLSFNSKCQCNSTIIQNDPFVDVATLKQYCQYINSKLSRSSKLIFFNFLNKQCQKLIWKINYHRKNELKCTPVCNDNRWTILRPNLHLRSRLAAIFQLQAFAFSIRTRWNRFFVLGTIFNNSEIKF